MGAGTALALLAFSLVVTLGAAQTFARRLDRLGAALGLPEALVGLLTALAADGPEISSAVIALARGEHAIGVGVVVGSNVFNIAAMIGLSALLGGTVALARASLALEGAMGLAATFLAAAVLLGWLAAPIATILLTCIGAPYLLALLGGAERVARAPLPAALRAGLAEAVGQHEHALVSEHTSAVAAPAATAVATTSVVAVRPRDALWVFSDVALIVAGSYGMVEAAISLGGRWGISDSLLGVLALGPLTSLPNALTGVRLGLAGRGAALVSETLNSNTINLAGGVLIPALFVTIATTSADARVDLLWLLGATCLCLACLARRDGAGRGAGAALVLLYLGFVVYQLV